MHRDPYELAMTLLTAGPVFLLALVFHEYCHAAVAARLGDRMAAWTGRLTMDPRVHLDPVGSVAFPALGIFLGWWGGGFPFIFGWARPVPFNPRDLRNPSRDTMLIALAGPAANAVLLVAFALLIRALAPLGVANPDGLVAVVLQMGAYGVVVNALLAIFNLIPLPPLDGSKVLAWALGPQRGARLLSLNPGLSMLIVIMAVWRGLLNVPMAAAIGVGEVLAGVPVGPLL